MSSSVVDDYSDAPTSIGELRAEKSQNARDWTPREALVHMLRMIDIGAIDPSAVVVSYHCQKDGRVHYLGSSRGATQTLGVLTRVTYMVNSDLS